MGRNREGGRGGIAGTVTEAGTVAAFRLLASVTIAPPAGAALVSVTVPVLPAPPATTVGINVSRRPVLPGQRDSP